MVAGREAMPTPVSPPVVDTTLIKRYQYSKICITNYNIAMI